MRSLHLLRSSILALAAVPLTLSLLAAPASAQGYIEVNQALVEAAGGFPYTIAQPGYYRLTGNLTKPTGGGTDNLIVISANDVTFDLAGFSLVGPGSCTHTDATGIVTCSGHLAGAGIAIAFTARNAKIRNGRIAGLTGGITSSGPYAEFEDLSLVDNVGQGIGSSGDGTIIRRVKAIRNDGTGFIVAGNGSVDSCVASYNDEYGLSILSESIVTRCHVVKNRFDGMELSTSSVFKDNVVADNYGPDPVRNGIDGGGNLCTLGGGSAVGC